MKQILITIAVVLLAGYAHAAKADETKSESSVGKTSNIAINELPHGNPEEVGMSSEVLKKIDGLVQQYIGAGRIEGAVIGIIRQSKVIYLEAHGVLEGKTSKPMPEDSIFIMASSTKPVIGLATMILVDEGLISPDDPVSKYIPEYKDVQVVIPTKLVDKGLKVKSQAKNKSVKNPTFKTKAKSKKDWYSKNKREVPEYRLEKINRPLTIHDLLTHTAGLGTKGGLGSLIVKDRATPEDTLATWVPRMAARPLDFQPGTRWAYSSGSGLKVVGRIIEIVSGMSLHEFIQSRILDPLNMKDTYWDVPEDQLYRMPDKFHSKAKGNGRVIGEDLSTYVSNSGGLFSTTRDYLHFQQMLVNGGSLFGHQILKSETVAMMTTNQAGNLFSQAAKGGPGQGYGYTTAITLDQKKSRNGQIAGTYSWGGAAGTVSWTTPSEKLSVVYMVQKPSDLPNKIGAIVREAIID
jgi:CubicO group peptidase (beta-lactamase class C family)|tara:strand:+ start:9155 stop:10543 length:1389 start_codon:yes stop_codon:yes gene_type:complete